MRWLEFVMSKYLLVPLSLVLLFWTPTFLDQFNRIDLVLGLILLWIAFWTVKATFHWKHYSQKDKGRYFKRLMLFLSVVGFFVALWLLNGVLDRHYSATNSLFLMGNNAKGYELHTLEIYPYTGFHPRAHCRVQGPIPIEKNPMYEEFDVRSGDYGFFVDFPLDNPPPKEKREFRIVLIGGSAAQGFGAQTNDHMLYRVLEKKLQSALGHSSLRVRIINLALANSTTYANFISLNKWGHGLRPDLILSFSGINDTTVPIELHGADMPWRFPGVLGLTRSTWVTESPRLLDDASKYFPALNTSLFGVSVRVFNSRDLGEKAWKEYRDTALPYFPSVGNRIVDLYAHAIKSIKRDFQGIPIMIAFQPYRETVN